MQKLSHPLPPLWNAESRVLILGSFPSQKSREVSFFYGHPQNRFWKLLPYLWNEPPVDSIAERTDFVLRHHIALWDVIAECEIEGSSDASIRDVSVNDFRDILQNSHIHTVFTNGALATKLYNKYCKAQTGLACHPLPSTSPANAAYSMERLAAAWNAVPLALKEKSL